MQLFGGWKIAIALVLSVGTAPALASPNPPTVTETVLGQLQLTEQSETAEDFILDTLEEQPATAEAFLHQHLDLSEAQKESIRDIYAQYEARLAEAVETYLVSVNRLNNLIAPAITNEAIIRARETVVLQERQIYDLLFQRTMAIRSVLIPEQRTTVNRLLRSLLNLGTPNPASTFPDDLIGQPAAEVVAQLQADGWILVVRTPRTLMFDKDTQTLNLGIDNELKVEDVLLRDLVPN